MVLTDKKKPLTKAEVEAKMALTKPSSSPPKKRKEKEDLATKAKAKPN